MKEHLEIERVDEASCGVKISVPAPEVSARLEKFFKLARKEANVRGFRKGKVPMKTVRSLFETKAQSAVSQSIFAEYYKHAMESEDQQFLGFPSIKNEDKEKSIVGEFKPDGSFFVEFVTEVMPKIDIQNYMGIPVLTEDLDPEDFYEAFLKEYQEQFSERRTITDRPAKDGDIVTIDFSGFLGDEKFEGGSAEGFVLENLNGGTFIAGFEENVVGMNTGEEKSFMTTFPEDYGHPQLAGKEVRFDVKLHSIVEKTPAKVDLDLALMAGHGSLEDFLSYVKTEAQKEASKGTRASKQKEIIDYLMANNTFAVPHSLIIAEMTRIKNGIQKEHLNQKVLKEILTVSEKNVRAFVMLNSIFEKEKMEIVPEELSTALDIYAEQVGKKKDDLVSALYNAGQMEGLVQNLKTNKVVDFLIDNATKEKDNG